MGSVSRREIDRACAEAASETALLQAARKLHRAKLATIEAESVYVESRDGTSEQRKPDQVTLAPTVPGIQWNAYLWGGVSQTGHLGARTITAEEPFAEEGVRDFTVEVGDGAPDDKDPQSSGVTVTFTSNPIDIEGGQARWVIAIPPHELDFLERAESFDGQTARRTLGGQAISGVATRPPDEAWPA